MVRFSNGGDTLELHSLTEVYLMELSVPTILKFCLLFLLGLTAISSYGQSVTGVGCSPSTVVGGNSSSGQVTISKKAPTGGFTVTLASSSGFAMVPSTVAVPAGSMSAKFTIGTAGVPSTQLVKITASGGGKSKVATLNILAPSLSILTITPSSVIGGNVAFGTLSLNGLASAGGKTITLISTSKFAVVPSSISISPGGKSANFVVTTLGVASPTSASITAKLASVSKTARLTITPASLSGLSLNPVQVYGGSGSVGTVTLSGSSPATGYTVTITNSNPTIASVPKTVAVPAGFSSATFTVATSPVQASNTANFTASKAGKQFSKLLTVLPNAVIGLAINPASVLGGTTSTGTVTIAGPAPATGFVVSLACSGKSVSIPSTVTVADGATTASFTISTLPVSMDDSSVIAASSGATVKSSTLTITAPRVSSLVFSPATVTGGSTSTGTVTLSVPAPVGGYVVPISSNSSIATVPSSIPIAEGETTGVFTVNTSPVSTDSSVPISASSAGTSVSAVLTVSAPKISSFTFSPPTVVGGKNATGTIVLTGPAPTSFQVALSSNNAAVSVPTSLTIAPGTSSATFTAATTEVLTARTVSVKANLNSVDVSTTLTVVTQPGLDPNSPWPKFHGNIQNTGIGSGVGASGNVVWEGRVGGSGPSSPAVGSDGTIYAGGTDGYLYAVKSSGAFEATIKWRVGLGNIGISSPAISSDGTIYVGASDDPFSSGGGSGIQSGSLSAVRPDGTLKWQVITHCWVTSSPTIGADGTIYIGTGDNYLDAINPNGTIKWQFRTGGWVGSSPAIGADGVIYVGSDDSNLYAINPDGTLKWQFSTGQAVESSPAIGTDGTVYFGSWDKGLYAINSDGTIKWTFTTGREIKTSPAIGADGTVYVGSDDKNLYAINPDGTLKWQFAASGQIASSPAIGADGVVYFGSDDTNLYAINSDGSLKWKVAAISGGQSSPAIGADGAIYIIGGNLACIR